MTEVLPDDTGPFLVRPLSSSRYHRSANCFSEYRVKARQEAAQAGAYKPPGSWAASSAIKQREEANKRALSARPKGHKLLVERGTLAQARKLGLHVVDVS